jgi:hypothetical protein
MRSTARFSGTIGRVTLVAVAGALVWLAGAPNAPATPPPDAPEPPRLTAPDPVAFESIAESLPEPAADEPDALPPLPDQPATDTSPPGGLTLYDSKGTGRFPLGMKIDGFMQVRWFEFARGITEWTDATGKPNPVENINSFNINRFMLTPQGYVANERIIWSLTLFGTTDNGRNDAIVPLGVVGWKFNENLSITGGSTFVAATREWIISNRWMQGVDRSMANTFFRPSYSPGVEFNGNLLDKELMFRAGVWNSIQGASSGVNRQGTSMAWAGNIWWEPLGPFGLGYSDMEHHQSPSWRLGCSGITAITQAIDEAGQNPEDTIVRLSDGTPIAQPGALGLDTQVTQFDYRLATVDAGWKYRGLAVNFEYYFRLLDDFRGKGPFDRTSTFDQGGQAYLAWCVVPRTYELYGRTSLVTGDYGTGQEYGGGFNWYLYGSRQSRFTIEALSINASPAQNILYPYRAGYTGTAIQTQLCVIF